MTPPYTFQPATMRDVPLLRMWQSHLHVRKWRGKSELFDGKELRDDRVARWIVEWGEPITYMQDYAVHGWGEHHFDYLPDRSRGIDQYIGEAGMLGRGHGKSFVGQRMQELFAAGVPVIAVDPHPDNGRAIAVYGRLGFAVVGAEQDMPWGKLCP